MYLFVLNESFAATVAPDVRRPLMQIKQAATRCGPITDGSAHPVPRSRLRSTGIRRPAAAAAAGRSTGCPDACDAYHQANALNASNPAIVIQRQSWRRRRDRRAPAVVFPVCDGHVVSCRIAGCVASADQRPSRYSRHGVASMVSVVACASVLMRTAARCTSTGSSASTMSTAS